MLALFYCLCYNDITFFRLVMTAMKTKVTPFQIAAEICAALTVFSTILYFLFLWPALPSQIPSHFDELGQPDAWNAKYLPALLLGVQIVLYLLLTLLSVFPKIWHLPVEVSEKSKPVLFSATRTLILDMKLLLVLAFGYLIFCICRSVQLSMFILLPMVLCVLGSMIYYFIRITKISLSDARRLLRERENEEK